MSQPTAEELVAAGAAALRAGERERARRLLSQAVRADPGHAQAWLFLAGAVSDTGQRRQCLERVLSLSPGHPLALKGLASLGQPGAAQPPPHAQAPAPSPRPEATPAHSAGPLLGRITPSAATRTTTVAPSTTEPATTMAAEGETTPLLLTLPLEPAPPPRPDDRVLRQAILAAGILLMLLGLALIAIILTR